MMLKGWHIVPSEVLKNDYVSAHPKGIYIQGKQFVRLLLSNREESGFTESAFQVLRLLLWLYT
jgi:hypothetical protein